MDQTAFIFAGFVVGLIVGLTGVGGGSLMTPLLIFGFGIKPALAVGTDLLFAAFTKMGGSINLAVSRSIDWKIVGALSLGSVPASLVTLYVLKTVGHGTDAFQHIITTTLGVALVLTAGATLYKAQFGASRKDQLASQPPDQAANPTKPLHPALPVVFGALVGVLITITSVGAGAIGVTALMLLYPSLPLSRIVAADIAYAVPITLVAGLGHASIGSVDWSLLIQLLAGSLPGIWLGIRLNSRWSDKALRTLLSLLIAYAGVRLLAL